MATLATYDPGHGIYLRSGVKTSLSDHNYRRSINIHHVRAPQLESSVGQKPQQAKLMKLAEDHGKSSLPSAYLSTGGANSRSA